MNSMYEILMDLPLFQGVSRDKLSELIEKTPFHFLKYSNGQEIIAANSNCTHMKFIISGKVTIETQCRNLKIKLYENLSSPNVLGPDYLFGRTTAYPFAAYANGDCGILQISKSDYINILQSDNVFLFNMLNVISRNSQRYSDKLLSLSTGSVAERLAFFITSLTQRTGTGIKISFKQKDMCTLLGIQHSSFINTMNKLQENGLITFTMSEIEVHNREDFLNIVHSNE